MRTHRGTWTAVLVIAFAVATSAQATRPRATLVVSPADVAVTPGGSVALVVSVSLPPDVHVQAHRPDDPLLIPTVLTIDAPEGIGVESVTYPQPVEFRQAARETPLLVLGPRFDISARLRIDDGMADEVRTVPVVLRYQACNDTVCFPPATVTAAWTLRVTR